MPPPITPLPTFPEFQKKGELSPFVPQTVRPLATAGTGVAGLGGLDIAAAIKTAEETARRIAPEDPDVARFRKMLLDPSLRYDDTQDQINLGEENRIAAGLPTPSEREAIGKRLEAQGADLLYQQLQGVGEAPHQGAYPQPNLPGLSLPDQPQTARPQVSPLAQLLSIGAGFASPRAAGGFNAAALEGALQGAQQENQRRQQIYKNDIAGRTIIYDAAMGQAKEKQRVAEANVDAASQSSVADYNRKMILAKAKSESLSAGNVAKSLEDFAKEHGSEERAQARASALMEKIKLSRDGSAERVKSTTELIKALEGTGSAQKKLTADILMHAITAMLASQRLQEQTKNRQEADARALKRTEYIQGELDTRAVRSQTGLTDRFNRGQKSTESRFVRGQAGMNTRQDKSQRLEAARINFAAKDTPSPEESVHIADYKRQQTHMKTLEEARDKAMATLAQMGSSGTLADGTTVPMQRKKRDDLVRQIQTQHDEMVQTQRRIDTARKNRPKRALLVPPGAPSVPGAYKQGRGRTVYSEGGITIREK